MHVRVAFGRTAAWSRERVGAPAQQVALRDLLGGHLAGFVDSRLVGSYHRLRASYPSHQPRIQGRSINIGSSDTERDYAIVA